MQSVVCFCEAFLLLPKCIHQLKTQGRYVHFASVLGRFWTTELLIKWTRDRVLNLQACQHFCVSAKAWERANTMLFWTHFTCLSRVWVNLALKYVLHFYAYCNKNKRGTSVQVIPNKQFRSSTWPRLPAKTPAHKRPCVCVFHKTIIRWICPDISDPADCRLPSPWFGVRISAHTETTHPSLLVFWPGVLQTIR